MKPTDIANPDYFHKVVDCQWACPAHTPVPEYIRLIAHGRYSDAYMINWKSNVFPGILGRTCDRPCEPACRRSRVEDETLVKGKKEPVAICRLKRVAADYKDDDIAAHMPKAPEKNGKRIACIGGGPSSLTVARDLAVIGYEIVIYDQDPKLGGFIRTQIPHFRLPESVIDEEVGYITGIGNIEFRHQRVDSMKAILAEGYDAVFVQQLLTFAQEGDLLIVRGMAPDDWQAPSRVWLFARTGGTWTLRQELVPQTGIVPGRAYGFSMAISKGHIVLGDTSARGVDEIDDATPGMALVFEERNGQWINTKRLMPAAPCAQRTFGNDVAIDWPIVVVGRTKNTNLGLEPGGAYVFDLAGDGQAVSPRPQ